MRRRLLALLLVLMGSLGLLQTSAFAATTRTAVITVNEIENAQVAYAYTRAYVSSDGSVTSRSTVQGITEITAENSGLTISDFSANSTSSRYNGYLLFFLKPTSEDHLLYGITTSGAGDIYSLDSVTTTGNLTGYANLSSLVAAAKDQGYVAAFGYMRSYSESSDVDASFRVKAIQATLEVTATATKECNVANEAMTFTVTPTTTDLSATNGKVTLSSVNITSLSVNGETLPASAYTKNADGTFTVTYTPTTNDDLNLSVTVAAAYNGALSMTAGNAVTSSTTVTKTATTTVTTHVWDAGEVTKQPTCTETGSMIYTCTKCQKTKVETIPALGHNYGNWTDNGNGGHTHICANDSSHTETKAHSFGSWGNWSAYNADGVSTRTRTCEACGATKTETRYLVTVNYYLDGTTTALQNAAQYDVAAGGSYDVTNAIPDSLTYNGVSYRKDSISGTVSASNVSGAATIHVYYVIDGWDAGTVVPTVMRYQVEHYQETLDGGYTLIATEVLAGEFGTTAVAEPKTIDHYHVNTHVSTLSGLLSTKEKPVQLLTLKVYYDLDAVTVTYDPDNGEETSTDTLKYGTTETVKPAPTKAGYTFRGWSNGEKTHQPGETFSATENVTLTALWTAVSQPGNNPGSDSVTGSQTGSGNQYTLSYVTGGGTAYQDEEYASGTQVNLSKVPSWEGYQFTGWYADEALTQLITSVTMDSSKTVYAGWQASKVPDLLNGDDHYAYIVGYGDGTVRPTGNITRAEVATIFFRLLQEEIRDENLTSENTYTDVSENAWYCKAVSTLTKLGILEGRSETIFDPDAAITRAELATICARFDTAAASSGSDFTDIEGHWAQADIERAAALGWVQGDGDGKFRPNDSITRAEAITMINRVLCRIPENEEDLSEDMNTWPDNSNTDAWYYLAIQEATNSHNFSEKNVVNETWNQKLQDPDWEKYEN
jgi:uncharacterized repeat protein (TIGR02543 family)